MDTSTLQYNYVVSRLGSFLVDYFIVSIIEVIIIFILFYDQIVQIVSGVNLLNIEYLIGLNGFYFCDISIHIRCVMFPVINPFVFNQVVMGPFVNMPYNLIYYPPSFAEIEPVSYFQVV